MKLQQQSLASACVLPMSLGHWMQVDLTTLSDKTNTIKMQHRYNSDTAKIQQKVNTNTAATAAPPPLTVPYRP